MKKTPKLRPKSTLAKNAELALKRAAKQARITALRHDTPIHVQSNSEVVALKP